MLIIVIALTLTLTAASLHEQHVSLESIRGAVVQPSEYPWQVWIGKRRNNATRNYNTHCTGSLISKRVVITSALCVENADLGNYQVAVGGGTATTTIANVQVHPRFDPEDEFLMFRYGVALLFLAEDQTAQQVALPTATAGAASAGRKVTALGWNSNKQLMEDETLVQDNGVCIENSLEYAMVDKWLLCVTDDTRENDPGRWSSDGKTAQVCMGNSGGPLVSDGGVLVGVAAAGVSCSDSFKGQTFVRSEKLLDWIQEHVGKNETLTTPTTTTTTTTTQKNTTPGVTVSADVANATTTTGAANETTTALATTANASESTMEVMLWNITTESTESAIYRLILPKEHTEVVSFEDVYVRSCCNFNSQILSVFVAFYSLLVLS